MRMGGQQHDWTAFPPGNTTGTHCTGGWMVSKAGLDGWGKSRRHRDSVHGPIFSYLHLVPMLRKSGAILLFPFTFLYVSDTNLPVYFYHNIINFCSVIRCPAVWSVGLSGTAWPSRCRHCSPSKFGGLNPKVQNSISYRKSREERNVSVSCMAL